MFLILFKLNNLKFSFNSFFYSFIFFSFYLNIVIYNNELLDKIKSLESIIQKRHTDQMTSLESQIGFDPFEQTDRKLEIEQENSNLECLKSDLSNMKSN